MATKELKTVPKISVKIWRPIIEKLDSKLQAACLRRDAYFTKVLGIEVAHLDREISVPNSQASYDHVAARLDEFDRKLVSLALPIELTTRINEVCARKRIVRDAFFNRLLLLLTAQPKTIDSLFFSGYEGDWRTDVWTEYQHEGPFFTNVFYPLETDIDPFWPIRLGLDLYNKGSQHLEEYIEPTTGESIEVSRDINGSVCPRDSLYARVLDRKVGEHNLGGFNCYVPDWCVPGHEAESNYRAKLDEFLKGM